MTKRHLDIANSTALTSHPGGDLLAEVAEESKDLGNGQIYNEHIRVWCGVGISLGSLKATFLSSVQNLGTNGGGGAVLVNPLTSSASGNLTRTLSDFQTCVFLLELIHQLALDIVGQLLRKRGLSTDPSWLGRLDPEDRPPCQAIFELQF